ncbi:unnamed protein product [Trypanosoma congolense IL3000]|uniref:WGS project CAEQ00000000 data, annotated contig 665 n=1 Tax=Trypanosoma congolense (strain IL3000) TaxID=1068625 RepID=F9WHL6_TRYCI|nr:unnamed protein product [Trypanosoma congolense IL3000]
MKRMLAPRVLNRQEGSVLKLETTRLQGWPLVRGYMPCNPCPNPQLFERVAGMRKASISGSSWRCTEKENPWGRALIPAGNAGAEARTHYMWPEDIKQQWKEIFIAAVPHLSQAPSHATPLSQGHYAPLSGACKIPERHKRAPPISDYEHQAGVYGLYGSETIGRLIGRSTTATAAGDQGTMAVVGCHSPAVVHPSS